MNPKRDIKICHDALDNNSAQSRIFLVLWFCMLAFFFISIMPNQAGGEMRISKPTLPKKVGLWTRPDSPQFVNANNIFDYMDGAGEIYLGYRFDHLESYEYKARNQKSILVELYFMKTSDDAFGLLSLDWGGEPVDLGQSLRVNGAAENSLWPSVIYGEGLLRLWSDTIYARVMSYQETPESKEAVMTLGRAIVKDRRNPLSPDLLKNLPATFLPNWILRKDRTSFFRSHLVLNSLDFLGQENMLDLGLTSEAVTAPYERKNSSGGQTRIQFLLVKYPDQESATAALALFHRVYIPEHLFQTKSDSAGEIVNMFPVEDGWLGYRMKDDTIAFMFECPDRETARAIVEQIK